MLPSGPRFPRVLQVSTAAVLKEREAALAASLAPSQPLSDGDSQEVEQGGGGGAGPGKGRSMLIRAQASFTRLSLGSGRKKGGPSVAPLGAGSADGSTASSPAASSTPRDHPGRRGTPGGESEGRAKSAAAITTLDIESGTLSGPGSGRVAGGEVFQRAGTSPLHFPAKPQSGSSLSPQVQPSGPSKLTSRVGSFLKRSTTHGSESPGGGVAAAGSGAELARSQTGLTRTTTGGLIGNPPFAKGSDVMAVDPGSAEGLSPGGRGALRGGLLSSGAGPAAVATAVIAAGAAAGGAAGGAPRTPSSSASPQQATKPDRTTNSQSSLPSSGFDAWGAEPSSTTGAGSTTVGGSTRPSLVTRVTSMSAALGSTAVGLGMAPLRQLSLFAGAKRPQGTKKVGA